MVNFTRIGPFDYIPSEGLFDSRVGFVRSALLLRMDLLSALNGVNYSLQEIYAFRFPR